jgi:hypothetical protein
LESRVSDFGLPECLVPLAQSLINPLSATTLNGKVGLSLRALPCLSRDNRSNCDSHPFDSVPTDRRFAPESGRWTGGGKVGVLGGTSGFSSCTAAISELCAVSGLG